MLYVGEFLNVSLSRLFQYVNMLITGVAGSLWVLHWPSHMKTHHGSEEWEAVMEMAKEDARRVPLPPDLFEVWNYRIFLSYIVEDVGCRGMSLNSFVLID